MPDQLPKRSKTPAQEAFETLAFLWGVVAVAAFFGWQSNVPFVHPLVQQVNRALSPYTLPLLQKTFGRVNPALGLLFNLAVLGTVLFVLSMALIAISSAVQNGRGGRSRRYAIRSNSRSRRRIMPGKRGNFSTTSLDRLTPWSE